MIAALGYGHALFRPFRADRIPCNRYAGTVLPRAALAASPLRSALG